MKIITFFCLLATVANSKEIQELNADIANAYYHKYNFKGINIGMKLTDGLLLASQNYPTFDELVADKTNIGLKFEYYPASKCTQTSSEFKCKIGFKSTIHSGKFKDVIIWYDYTNIEAINGIIYSVENEQLVPQGKMDIYSCHTNAYDKIRTKYTDLVKSSLSSSGVTFSDDNDKYNAYINVSARCDDYNNIGSILMKFKYKVSLFRLKEQLKRLDKEKLNINLDL